ncbi:hypothetical protein FOL47_008002 [Perkinsus chesapeaki]|uniref:Uncharacterized protein n=1 Tax=Perkinsus chesapeaki TaxID=330153 RepID=A0A7J6LGF9_PERCH|nr:hypothetical protein FOL47_008002 [Perkinsus chesapeaki]
MPSRLLLSVSTALTLSAYATFGGPNNIRMRVTTKNYCNHDLVDADGNPAPCGISQSMETYGLTLPGMDDGILTTREDIIIVTDGQVSVKAMPNYPYQYIMTVNSAESKRVEQLYNHQSFLLSVGRDTTYVGKLSSAASGRQGLVEQGWAYEGTDMGTAISTFSKKGPEGVDPVDGTNYTAIYQAGLMPDSWVLYYDESTQQPVKLMAVDTYVGSKIFQESTFEEVEDLNSDMTVEGATQAMYDIYRVDHQRRLDEADEYIPLAMPDYISGDFLPERSRAFFDNHNPVDWMSDRRALRQSGMSRGIEYFTIEKNSAADVYFHALSDRQLAQVVNFEYPKGCSASDTDKYCLSAEVDVGLEGSVSVKAGITFLVPGRPDQKAYLKLSAALKKDADVAVLDLAFEAAGCAPVFQYGAEVSISIDICLKGSGSGKSLLQPDKRTFYGEASITAVFKVKLPKVPSFGWTIEAEVQFTAKPHNDISAYGKITASSSVKVAAASVGFDILGNTVDNIANKWEFVSNVLLKAHAGVWKFKKTWDKSWVLWHAGPVVF